MSSVPIVTYGGLDLNDQANYWALAGFDPGNDVTTWDEHKSYSGEVAQYNVTDANLVEVRIPLRIVGGSLKDFWDAVEAINTLIAAGDQTLVFDDGGYEWTYSCAQSQRLDVPREASVYTSYSATVELVLMRYPGVTTAATSVTPPSPPSISGGPAI